MNGVRSQALLWYWQRVSAMVLALCVVVHLGGILYAVRGGLSAGEVLARTRNAQLDAEVRDLKEGLEMVEEKARFELGMVKPDELLVQVTSAKPQ